MDARTGEREKLKVKKVAFALMRVSEKKKTKHGALKRLKQEVDLLTEWHCATFV